MKSLIELLERTASKFMSGKASEGVKNLSLMVSLISLIFLTAGTINLISTKIELREAVSQLDCCLEADEYRRKHAIDLELDSVHRHIYLDKLEKCHR